MTKMLWIAAAMAAGCGGASSSAPSPGEPEGPTPEPSGPEARTVTSHGGGEGCRETVARYEEDHGPAAETADAESQQAVKEQLNAGSYLNRCNVATSASVDICAAIANGEVMGVTVEIDPGEQEEADCVAAAVAAMSFPKSPALVEARTSFEPSLN